MDRHDARRAGRRRGARRGRRARDGRVRRAPGRGADRPRAGRPAARSAGRRAHRSGDPRGRTRRPLERSSRHGRRRPGADRAASGPWRACAGSADGVAAQRRGYVRLGDRDPAARRARRGRSSPPSSGSTSSRPTRWPRSWSAASTRTGRSPTTPSPVGSIGAPTRSCRSGRGRWSSPRTSHSGVPSDAGDAVRPGAGAAARWAWRSPGPTACRPTGSSSAPIRPGWPTSRRPGPDPRRGRRPPAPVRRPDHPVRRAGRRTARSGRSGAAWPYIVAAALARTGSERRAHAAQPHATSASAAARRLGRRPSPRPRSPACRRRRRAGRRRQRARDGDAGGRDSTTLDRLADLGWRAVVGDRRGQSAGVARVGRRGPSAATPSPSGPSRSTRWPRSTGLRPRVAERLVSRRTPPG